MYVTLTRKGIVDAIAIMLLAVGICSRFSAVGTTPKNGETNAQRVQYIKNLNINIQDECIETKKINIPAKFGDVYTGYNTLQKQAGFDLLDYAGCGVTLYTYAFTDKPDKRVNILVYKGRIIGGDISDTSLEGSMSPLQIQKQKE